MEPLLLQKENGCAPIIGWTDASPNESPIDSKKSLESSVTPLEPRTLPSSSSLSLSSTSSGIDLDIADKSSARSASDYSPTISSIFDEPIFQSSQSVLGDRRENSFTVCEDKNNNPNVEEKTLMPILRHNSTQKFSFNDLSNNINNDYQTNEGVKFADVDDKDSICSVSYYDDDIDEADDKPKIPDGGWGWVVVMASLMLSMIADGISFSFGLLYIEFLNHFGESNSKTSWIGGLFMSVPLLSGPIMSALVDKYGCRTMTIMGGIVSSFGFVMASFSDSIGMLLLTFGIIAGLGLGMCYVTAVVSVAFWFDKKRTLAVGLSACGTGIGTFIYAPLTQYFIDEFGWRGTILLLAGTFLQMCICGAVMRDPEWWTLEQNRQTTQSNKSLRGTSSCGSVSKLSGGGDSMFPGIEELRLLMKSGETPEYILTTLATSIAVSKNLEAASHENNQTEHFCNSVVNLPTFVRRNEKVPLEVLELLSSNKKVYNVILENYPSLLSCRSCSENKLSTLINENPIRVPITMSMKVKTSKKNDHEMDIPEEANLTNSPLLPLDLKTKIKPIASTTKIVTSPKSSEPWFKRQFTTNQNYLRGIKMHRNSVMHRGAMMNIAKYRLRASSCPNIYRNSIINIPQEEDKWYTEVLDMLKSMFAFRMFLEFHFLLTNLSTTLLFISFIVPYFYVTKHMTKNGYTEEDGAMQISIIGVANAVGMVFLGWIGDKPWLHITKTYAWCLFLCGCATLAYPLITFSYYLLSINSALFGLFFASSYSFTPAILVELLPLERFTTAYGLILLCQGIGNLIGPPLAGWIFDVVQSWDLCFYLAGVSIILSGILIGIIPLTKNFRIWGSAPLEKDLEKISQKDNISIA